MPGFNIHLAIGNKYIKNNKIKNKREFFKGIVYPDLVSDKSISHFSLPKDYNDVYKSLHNKVNLKEFIINSKIDTDYEKGVFLHILTDYLFYTEFFDNNYLKNVDYRKFKNDYYYSLSLSDPYIKKKYKVKFSVYKKEILNKKEKFKNYNYMNDSNNILNLEKLDIFIDYVSKINIENFYKESNK